MFGPDAAEGVEGEVGADDPDEFKPVRGVEIHFGEVHAVSLPVRGEPPGLGEPW